MGPINGITSLRSSGPAANNGGGGGGAADSSNTTELLLSLATLIMLGILIMQCVGLYRQARGPPAAATSFNLKVYIEDGDLTCNFMMRIEPSDLASIEMLLDTVSRAAYEATEISFDFTDADLQRLDALGRASAVKRDAEVSRLRTATGIRILANSGDLEPLRKLEGSRIAVPDKGSSSRSGEEEEEELAPAVEEEEPILIL